MKTILKTFGSSVLISLLFIVPLIIMEVVNRRRFHEEFPFALFFTLWSNIFAISLILLPIILGRRRGNQGTLDPVPAQGNTILTNPVPAAVISVLLILSPGILPLLDSLGWISMETLVNGPNPEVFYLPGILITFGFFSLMVAGGVIARGPIARTLRAGGSLLAHPIHLIIVFLLVATLVYGVTGLISDQWPCFMGVPGCD